MPDCVVSLWEGAQLLLAKVKDADRWDWYILSMVVRVYTITSLTVLDSWMGNALNIVKKKVIAGGGIGRKRNVHCCIFSSPQSVVYFKKCTFATPLIPWYICLFHRISSFGQLNG